MYIYIYIYIYIGAHTHVLVEVFVCIEYGFEQSLSSAAYDWALSCHWTCFAQNLSSSGRQ